MFEISEVLEISEMSEMLEMFDMSDIWAMLEILINNYLEQA